MFTPEKGYYNIAPLLSYKALLNFDTGGRSTGKTYSFKKWAISDWEKTGGQFLYLRRYKSEIKDIGKFFDDIPHKGLPLNVKGHTLMCGKEIMGCAMPLSTAITKKSVPFPKVNKGLFDEFITPEKTFHRYLKDEAFQFFEFYDTVSRLRIDPKTGEELPLNKLFRMVFFANNVSLLNPYYLFFNAFPKPNKRFTRIGDDIVVGQYRNKLFEQTRKNTRFGRLIAGTAYGDYAIDNEVYQDNDDFIRERPQGCTFAYSIVYGTTKMGIWYDRANGWIFASRKIDPSSKQVYALTSEDHRENTFLITRVSQSRYIQNLVDAFKMGYLYFESATVKAETYKILSKLVTA